jgi:hypothetical protein
VATDFVIKKKMLPGIHKEGEHLRVAELAVADAQVA